MAGDRSYVDANRASLDRLRGFVDTASDGDLVHPLNDGWTVASVLAHVAFWDLRIVACIDAWGPDGSILYIDARGVWRVQASGGAPTNLVPLDADAPPSSPAFLPDGHHFLISVRSTDPSKAGTFVEALEGGGRNRILAFATTAQYAGERLLFVRDHVLYAQAFDLSRLQLEGDPVPLAERVTVFSASDNGGVAYAALSSSEQADFAQLEWFDRSGALSQHAAMSVFRAVEHRVPLARCANTGLTFLVDPWGRSTTPPAIFTDALVVAPLPDAAHEKTPFTRFGDTLGPASAIACVLLLLLSLFRPRAALTEDDEAGMVAGSTHARPRRRSR